MHSTIVMHLCLIDAVDTCASPSVFFFSDTAPTEIYTLSLHDALPICSRPGWSGAAPRWPAPSSSSPSSRPGPCPTSRCSRDRKSTRLNSSHSQISYAVFCLKKKNTKVVNIVGIEQVIIDVLHPRDEKC